MAMLFGLFVPGMAIYSIMTGRNEWVKSAGILMALAVFRSFTRSTEKLDEIGMLFLIPIVAAIILSFFIPHKMKMEYNVIEHKPEESENTKGSISIRFEEEKLNTNSEVLDDQL